MKNVKRVLALLLALTLMLALAGCNSSDYKAAGELYEAGDYKAASEKYAALGDYKDAAEKAVDSDYMYAREMYYAGAYEAAAMAFKALGDYEDSADMNTECVYKLGVETFNAGEYANAIEIFLEVEDYEDSEDFISRARDAIMRESVLGEWKCRYDLSELFTEGFSQGFGMTNDEDPSQYFDFSGFEAIFVLTVNDDDSFTLDVDREAFAQALEGIKENCVIGMKAMIEDLLEEEASAYGFTLDQLLPMVGAGSIDELIVMSLGMDLEAYVDKIVDSATSEDIFSEFPIDGTFSMSDTTVSFTELGDAEYNVVLEQLVFSTDGENDYLNDVTFTR